MLSRLNRPKLSFEDAMSIHVHRAQRRSHIELIRRFGNYPKEILNVLTGKLYPNSREAAVERFARGDYWHPEIARMIDDSGYLQLLTALAAPRPKPGSLRAKFGWITRDRKGLRFLTPLSSR